MDGMRRMSLMMMMKKRMRRKENNCFGMKQNVEMAIER